jgi:hypothetical protein
MVKYICMRTTKQFSGQSQDCQFRELPNKKGSKLIEGSKEYSHDSFCPNGGRHYQEDMAYYPRCEAGVREREARA